MLVVLSNNMSNIVTEINYIVKVGDTIEGKPLNWTLNAPVLTCIDVVEFDGYSVCVLKRSK